MCGTHGALSRWDLHLAPSIDREGRRAAMKRGKHTPTPLIVIKTPSLIHMKHKNITSNHLNKQQKLSKICSPISPPGHIMVRKNYCFCWKLESNQNPEPNWKMEKRGAVYHHKNFHKYWSWRRCFQNQDTIIFACQITKACHQHNSPIKVRLSCFKKWLKSHLVTGWSVNYVQVLQI